MGNILCGVTAVVINICVVFEVEHCLHRLLWHPVEALNDIVRWAFLFPVNRSLFTLLAGNVSRTLQLFLCLWSPRFCCIAGNWWLSLGDKFPWYNHSHFRFFGYRIVYCVNLHICLLTVIISLNMDSFTLCSQYMMFAFIFLCVIFAVIVIVFYYFKFCIWLPDYYTHVICVAAWKNNWDSAVTVPDHSTSKCSFRSGTTAESTWSISTGCSGVIQVHTEWCWTDHYKDTAAGEGSWYDTQHSMELSVRIYT